MKKTLDNGLKLHILYIYRQRKLREESSHVNLIISNTSSQPIYEQIVSQIKRRIVSGELAPGEMLPSIRALAKDLRISVITTKRAYEELEREGLIVTAAGRGSFVAERNAQWLREDVLRRIEEHMQSIAELAAQIDLSGEELCEMLRTLRQEDEYGRD